MARILIAHRFSGRLRAALRGPGRWALLIVALWCVVSLPFALGERTLIERDVFTTHLPYKYFGAQQLAQGRIPAFFPEWSLGQPFRGNPNALPYYPGNLLYLVLPFWSAFNLHYLLHWLLAFLALRALARELGQREEAATLAGLTYAGSGYLVTLLTFYNLLTVVAWMPLVLLGLARGGRRGLAIGGLAGAMVILGGEPVTALLAAPVALLVAVGRHGWRRGLGLGAGAAAIAAALALPQIVAVARVAPHTFRAAHGLPLEQVTVNALSPARLFELLLPLPFGVPAWAPPWAYWAHGIEPWVPYIYSGYLGVVGVVLAGFALRRRRGWAITAAAILVVGWLAGLSAEATSAVTLGIFRFPQKLLFPFTLVAALLAGWGLEAALERPRAGRALRLAGAALLLVGIAMALDREPLAQRLGAWFSPSAPPATLFAQAFSWAVQLAAAGILVAAAGWAIGRGRAGLLVVLQLVALAQLAPLVPSDRTERYRQPPRWAAEVGPARSVVAVPFAYPPWETRPFYELAATQTIDRRHLDYEMLEPGHAAVAGLGNPLAPDLDGITWPLQVFLSVNMIRADWEGRVRWIERLGGGAIVRDMQGPGPGLEVIDRQALYGRDVTLARVPHPRPFLFRPREVRLAPGPPAAYLAIAKGELADDVATVSKPVEHSPFGAVRLVSRSPDEIVFDVEGEGGVVGLLRENAPLWRARLEDGTPLEIVTVDLVLVGVVTPPGDHRVTLSVSSRPEWLGAIGTLFGLVAVAALWRRPA